MREDIEERIILEGRYIATTGATVRQTAKVFHFSKSTVHKDVTERLKRIDKTLYQQVKKVLETVFYLSAESIKKSRNFDY